VLPWLCGQLHQIRKMRLRVTARLDKIDETGFARLKFGSRKSPAKKSVFGDLTNASITIKCVYVCTTYPVRLARQAHHPA
jgi:hypothetical protein